MNLDWEVWEHESTTTTEAKSHRTMAINQSECFFWWYLHQTQIVPQTQFSDKYHMLRLFWILYNHQIVNHLLQLSFKKPNQKGLIPGIDLKLYIRGCSVFINDVITWGGGGGSAKRWHVMTWWHRGFRDWWQIPSFYWNSSQAHDFKHISRVISN